MFISAGWILVVPITDVKMTLSVADISVEPIIGTPLITNIGVWLYLFHEMYGKND